jgi:mannosyltransferase OCH1-like enzyme
MFRYFLMYKYGGIYADMDYIMFKPFDMLNTNAKVILPAARDIIFGMTYYIGNCIFASEPNHPFWKMVIDTLFTETRENFKSNDIDAEIDHVISATGPSFLYRIMKKWFKENPDSFSDIYIPPRYMFHPPTERNNTVIQRMQHEKKHYGMHLCAGSWLHNKL